MRRIRIPERFWHAHAHSRNSIKDAISEVSHMVDVAHGLGQPALALTDHGNMGGAIQLYKHARRAGIVPFPGSEFYLKRSVEESKRYHIGIIAFTTEGYEALVKLSSRSHTRPWFNHKPHVTFDDFAEFSERGWTQGLALTTGCYFGMVVQTLITQGMESAEWLIKTLATWFPHTYVELQHHGIDHEGITDEYIVDALDSIARVLGLPTIITQDAHYCTQDEKPLHETLKRLVSWGDDGDDAVFPGDSFHLAPERFVRGHYAPDVWARGLEGLEDLLSRHTLQIPELENYSYRVPDVTAGDPLDELDERCQRIISDEVAPQCSQNRQLQRYVDRYDEELDVVRDTGMAGYLMLNAQLCDQMRDRGIFYQARGSAGGSLICWLLQITQMDPIEWDLRYERFLSRDRTKPPDIDLDIEDDRRDEVIDMLGSRFPVQQIGTWAEFGVDASTGRGSLLVAYLSRLRKDGVSPGRIGMIKTLADVDAQDRQAITDLGRYKTYKSYGTHAGGLVITTTRQELERIPTMLVASSDTVVTQFDGDDIEDLGLLKEDILGQKSLSTIRRCCEMIGYDAREGWDWIPLDDKTVFRSIRRGDVDGVFQLEGWTNRKGCKELRPKKLRDHIHLVAIYRPATIDTGLKDVYIARRAGWEAVPDRHPILMRAFKETHGVPVFQDQVIVVLRQIGFTPDDLTRFLKAVKASNENIGDAAKVIAGYKQMFANLAIETGFSNDDIVFTWEAIEGFSKYGFNKAHATTYGHRSYVMGYLREHHALELHTALLQTWAGTPKEKEYILSARNAGIRLLKPDVNISGSTWTLDRGRQAIRRGLVSIKGVGPVASEEIARHAPFKDIDDLIDRCDNRAVTGGRNWTRDGTLNGVLGTLQDAGALKSMGV